MCCDFITNDQQIVTSSLEGEISIYSTKRAQRILLYESLPILIKESKENRPQADERDETQGGQGMKDSDFSNIIYQVVAVRNVADEENTFLYGAQDQKVTKVFVDYDGFKIQDFFSGHSSSIRSMNVSKDGSQLATGCEDHSLRIWDYKTCKAKSMLVGHNGVVTGGSFLNSNTLVSSSWDMKIMIWKV